jgi:hypothetical protein
VELPWAKQQCESSLLDTDEDWHPGDLFSSVTKDLHAFCSARYGLNGIRCRDP